MLHDLDNLPTIMHKGRLLVKYASHPCAWKCGGLVYLHRVIAENKIGRYLKDKEIVHHIDGDPLNNTPSNLLVTTVSAHPRIHNEHNPILSKQCITCRKKYKTKLTKRKYCSARCAAVAKEKIKWPSAKELRRLVWSMPTSKLACKLGVSDKAIEKRCCKFGIPKPARGYWTKLKGVPQITFKQAVEQACMPIMELDDNINGVGMRHSPCTLHVYFTVKKHMKRSEDAIKEIFEKYWKRKYKYEAVWTGKLLEEVE